MSPNEDPFALSDELVEAVAALRPITATAWGVPGHDAEWDDLSPEGLDRVASTLETFAKRAAALTTPTDRWERLCLEVLRDFLRVEQDRHLNGDAYGDLNSIASPFQYLRLVFDLMDSKSIEGWRARAARLETLDEALDGYRESLTRGLDTGHAVAARQVRAVIEQARVHASPKSYFHGLGAALDASGIVDANLRERVVQGAGRAAEAFGRFADWLEEAYLPRARESDGVGRDRYVRDAARFLGMQLDPEETYAWGWREIAAIDAQMRTLAGTIAPGKTVSQVLTLLRTAPEYAVSGHATFLEVMRERQTQALAQLTGTQFDVPTAVRTLEVQLAPPGGPLGAYYVPPTDGFARAGGIWYSLGEDAPVALFDQVATAYHEGFPGHHLQIGIQVSLTERLSRLHRLADGYSGYAEGWALYSEQLMAELGYYEKPEYLFGMLACQMLRACRVAIDIGSHLELQIPADQPFHPGQAWTFERGVEMLESMGGLDADHARSEMTRYLGWPGQAISYKVGQRVILELRAEAQKRDGAEFDAKAFHARVLGCGNVGLDQLRALLAEAAE